MVARNSLDCVGFVEDDHVVFAHDLGLDRLQREVRKEQCMVGYDDIRSLHSFTGGLEVAVGVLFALGASAQGRFASDFLPHRWRELEFNLLQRTGRCFHCPFGNFI